MILIWGWVCRTCMWDADVDVDEYEVFHSFGTDGGGVRAMKEMGCA
jgi:hypothetical protein